MTKMTNIELTEIEAATKRILRAIAPDWQREGLKETPARVARAFCEWTEGYQIDPPSLLKEFADGAEGYDSFVIVHNIPFISHCEHHLAPIHGTAHVGYLPRGKIVGLSKLVRVVDAYARRLQVQERATVQIAECVHSSLDARATGVIIRASHGCMSSRGVRAHGSVTTSSAMLGELRDEPAMRAEFLSLCAMAEKTNV